MVRYGHRNHVPSRWVSHIAGREVREAQRCSPILRAIPTLATFLASPPFTRFRDLLTAALRLASRVCQVLRLDVHDCRTAGERIRSSGFPELGVPDISDGTDLRAVKFAPAAGHHCAVGVRMECLCLAIVVKPMNSAFSEQLSRSTSNYSPSLEAECFWNIGIDIH